MACSMEILNFLEQSEHQQKFQGVLDYFNVPLGEHIDYDPDLVQHPVASEKGVFREEFENKWVYSAFEEWNLPMVLFLFDKHIDEFMENDSLIKLLAQDGNKTAQTYLSNVCDDY